MHYVIIGNSAAAIGAIEGIRRIDKGNPITLIADESYPTYSRPLISYYLEGKVAENEMGYRAPDFYTANRVFTRLATRVTQVEPGSRQVVLEDEERLSYDRLLIATGSRPVVPPIKGLEAKGVFFFNRFDDVRAIRTEARAASKAVVIGAGLTGLKAAEALSRLGVKVTVVEISPLVLGTILDSTGAEIVQEHLKKSGISFKMGVPVVGLSGEPQEVHLSKNDWDHLKEKYRKYLIQKNRVKSVLFSDGSTLPVDLVVIATGVQPNLDIVEGTPIAVNRGILVNEHLQTTVPDIYAAGDVSEGWDCIHNERRIIATLPNAYKQGEVAGRHMAGDKISYPGGIAMNSVKFFGLPIATAGISNSKDPRLEVISHRDINQNNYRRITLRDGRLIGFICIGNIGRVGILTALIKSGISVKGFEERLLQSDIGLIDLPEEVRRNWNWERGEGYGSQNRRGC